MGGTSTSDKTKENVEAGTKAALAGWLARQQARVTPYLIKARKLLRVELSVLHTTPRVKRDRLITGLHPLDTSTGLIDGTF